MKLITSTGIPKNPSTCDGYFFKPDEFNLDRYLIRTDRNRELITLKEQLLYLLSKRLGIAGMGGMGGYVGANFMRAGIGELVVADNQLFDDSNIHRQFAAFLDTVEELKTIATIREYRRIATDIPIWSYPGVNEDTVYEFIKGCHVISDEIELWELDARMLLHDCCREEGITIFSASSVAHATFVTKYDPEAKKTIHHVTGYSTKEVRELVAAAKRGDHEARVLLMKAALRFAAPKLPEYSKDLSMYSTRDSILESLEHDMRAPIIATNPPMAAGVLSNQILMYLLQESEIERNFETPPVEGGYLMFDSGTFTTEIFHGNYWEEGEGAWN